MKKSYGIIAIILLIILIVSACSPGGTAPASSRPASPAPASETPAASITPSPDVSATPSPSPKPSASVSPSSSPKPKKSPEKKEPTEAEKKAAFVKKTKTLKSGTVVDVKGMDRETLNACFFAESIPDSVFKRMQGKSFKKDCTTKKSDLRYIKTLYYGFDKKTHVGEIVMNKTVADDVIGIFRDLYKAKYMIERMKLIDDYGAVDLKSTTDDNTSGFNFRHLKGSSKLSNHAYGRALDINPRYNPYIYIGKNGKKSITPYNGQKYVDRSIKLPYIIRKNDICEKTFRKHGFSWGGDWRPAQDYQHFEKLK